MQELYFKELSSFIFLNNAVGAIVLQSVKHLVHQSVSNNLI